MTEEKFMGKSIFNLFHVQADALCRSIINSAQQLDGRAVDIHTAFFEIERSAVGKNGNGLHSSYFHKRNFIFAEIYRLCGDVFEIKSRKSDADWDEESYIFGDIDFKREFTVFKINIEFLRGMRREFFESDSVADEKETAFVLSK